MPVAVVEGERGGEAGHGDAVLDARAHRFPPRVLDRETQAGVSRQQTLAHSVGTPGTGRVGADGAAYPKYLRRLRSG